MRLTRTIPLLTPLLLALAAACSGTDPEPSSGPAPLAVTNPRQSGYVRITQEYASPQGMTLYQGQIYRRVEPRGEPEQGAYIEVFEGGAYVPWTHAEATSDPGSLPSGGELQAAVQAALLRLARASACRGTEDPTQPTNHDTPGRRALEERQINEALAPLFRRYRADPARYADFRSSVQPRPTSLRPNCQE